MGDPESGGGEPELGGGAAPMEPATPAEPVAPAPVFDPKALAQELGSVIKQSMPQPEKPKMTPEEAKQLLRVWEPTDDFLEEFGNIEKQKDAFIKMRDGLIRQADTIVQMRLQELHQQVQTQLEPALSYVEQQRVEVAMNKFNSKYPALADPKVRPVMDAVATKLQGQKFSSQDEMFDALAKGVEATIKQFNPGFTLGDQQKQKAQTSSGGIAVTSPGGGGGGGGQGSASTSSKGNKALSILGDV